MEQSEQHIDAGKPHGLLKRCLWIALGLLVAILLLPLTLYIPWVQNVVARWACEQASEATGMTIEIERILIKWPLDVSVDGLRVIEASGDTLVAADNLTSSVAPLPLLHLDVELDSTRLTRARVRYLSSDSSLKVRADVNHLGLNSGGVSINDNKIKVDEATLVGGDVSVDYYAHLAEPDSVHEPPTPWFIEARRLNLADVRYKMTMMPEIETLTAQLSSMTVTDGVVDVGRQVVKVATAHADSLVVDYKYPTAAEQERYAAAHPPVPDPYAVETAPWRVEVDSVRVTRSAATYAVTGSTPAQGFDSDHITVNDINIAVDNLHNEGIATSLHVSDLTGTERCGLRLTGMTGDIAVDSLGVSLDSVRVSTLLSELAIDGRVDMTGEMTLRTDSKIALQEVSRALPGLKPMLDGVPQVRPIAVTGAATGTLDRLSLQNVRVDMPRYITAKVDGTINNVTDVDRLSGDIGFDATFANIDFVKPLVLDKDMARQVALPPMRVKGKASLHGTEVATDLAMSLRNGEAVGSARFDSSTQGYDLDLSLKNFPVKAVLPLYEIGDVTGRVTAHGQGFDFANPSTDIDARIDIVKAQYNGVNYENLTFDGTLGSGEFAGNLKSGNENCAVDMAVNGMIDGPAIKVDATGQVSYIDLRQMGLADFNCLGSGNVDLHCDINMEDKTGEMDVRLTDMQCRVAQDYFVADTATFTARATRDMVQAQFINEDNLIDFAAACGVDTLLSRLQQTATVAMSQFERRALNIDTLQAALPPFSLSATMGRDGLVQRYVSGYDIDFRNAALTMSNDSAFRMSGKVNAISIGTTTIDTLSLDAGQWEGKYLAFRAHMGNRRGTMDEFAQVTAEGGILGSTIDFLVMQQNIDRKVGYRLGLHATLTDTAVVSRLFPQEMTIGYRKWQINKDNFANYNYHTHMFDADIDLRSDSSSVRLVTERAPRATTEDIHIDVDNLQLSEWTHFLKSFPEMDGRLDLNSDVVFDGTNLEGSARMSLDGFTYNNRRVGNIGLNATYTVDPNDVTTGIEADMTIDNEHVALLSGSLNDNNAMSPLNLNLSLYRFPLRRAVAFVPIKMMSARGYVTGTLSATGTLDNPMLSGQLQPDSASLRAPLYSAELRLSDHPILINNNEVRFDHYKLYGANDAPVDVNGVVNLRDLDSPMITLDVVGNNVQVVAGEQRTFSELFGKGFVDANARVRTIGRRLDVNANVSVLPTTNVTYVMQDEVRALDSDFDEDMVTFVNLNDSTDVFTPILMTAAEKFSINVLANLEVKDGTKLNVYLSPEGTDRANITGGGHLKYRMDFAGKSDFTGSYTVENGSVRYSPPLISQKNFTIAPGSSVTWTGDLLNPTLDLSATDRVKTSVSGDDGNTVVNFDVTAIVEGTLSTMKLAFDMSADDMAVQNDLQSMSTEQRSQTAINMLLYNTYSGNSAANNINNLTAGSALFSFVNSQLNNWASKFVKGVDLQLGINQYEGQNRGGIQTSYSYRLSKSLFNDRFKIVVGGEYSTDATTSESIANNLLSEVSLEYLLNDSGNMLVRLFRHTDFESVLEGQVSKMGVGFVLKHKLARIDDLFRRRPKVKPVPIDTVPPSLPSDTTGETPVYYTIPLDSTRVQQAEPNATNNESD